MHGTMMVPGCCWRSGSYRSSRLTRLYQILVAGSPWCWLPVLCCCMVTLLEPEGRPCKLVLIIYVRQAVFDALCGMIIWLESDKKRVLFMLGRQFLFTVPELYMAYIPSVLKLAIPFSISSPRTSLRPPTLRRKRIRIAFLGRCFYRRDGAASE
jgi:hypothetical protein